MRRSHLLAPALVLDAVLALASPKPIRSAARLGLTIYAGTIVWPGIRSARRAEHPGDALTVPLVLAVMHFAHGVGELRGAVRHGVPLAGLANVGGLERAAAALAPAQEPVFAPSLAHGANLYKSSGLG